MEYIMGYNVKKDNFEKRCNCLVEMLTNATKSENKIKTNDILVDTLGHKVKEIRYKHFLMLFQSMIEDIYPEDICEHDLYYGWIYSYISRVFEICTIEEFILECDGFFSYLAIYEIIETLKEKGEENHQIKSYTESEGFIKLESIFTEIMDIFIMNLGFTMYTPREEIDKKIPSWVMNMNWNYDGYDRLDGKGTNWEELNNKYSIQDLINQISDDILDFKGCEELSKYLKELKYSILPENTLKSEDKIDSSNKPSKNQIRIDLPQALSVIAEARTKEMIKLNEMFELVGERTKAKIESGEMLSNEEEEIKNNIINTMNREQALGEVLSIYYGEDVIDNNIRRMPTHIIFSTLEEWMENPRYMKDSEGSIQEVKEHNIFCERLIMSINLVVNRIKSQMEREVENLESVNRRINNVDDALYILGKARSMEISFSNEISEMIKNENDEDTKLELSILGMESILKEEALRKVYTQVTGSTELDYNNDGIIELEKAIQVLENWVVEPVTSDDSIEKDELAEFCNMRNAAIKIILEEVKEGIHIKEESSQVVELDIVFDEVNEIDFKDKVFVTTGDFSYGSDDLIEGLITEKGGIYKRKIIKKVDYLVVGNLGSTAWTYGKAGGLKLEKANEYKEKGSNVKIISEDTLVKCFKM